MIAYFKFALFFLQIFGEKVVAGEEISDFCQNFENELSQFTDFQQMNEEIAGMYINHELLNRARKIENKRFNQSQPKLLTRNKPTKSFSDSPMCYVTRITKIYDENHAGSKMHNYIGKIKLNYFQNFANKKSPLTPNN